MFHVAARRLPLASARVWYFQLASSVWKPAITRWFLNREMDIPGSTPGGVFATFLLHFLPSLGVKNSRSFSLESINKAAGSQINWEGLAGSNLPRTQVMLGGRFGT